MSGEIGDARKRLAGAVAAEHAEARDYPVSTFQGPVIPVNQQEKDRRELSEIETPFGFQLGDVIAQTVLTSDWLAARDAAAKAEGARSVVERVEAVLAKAERNLPPRGYDIRSTDLRAALSADSTPKRLPNACSCGDCYHPVFGPNTDGDPCDWCQDCGCPSADHSPAVTGQERGSDV